MKGIRTAGSLAFAVTFLMAGCDDRSAPTATSAGGPPPEFEIQDAGHHDGNAHFYFLPPVVPSLPSFSGVFDGSLAPEVQICQWADFSNPLVGVCALPLVARFTTTTGPGSETVRVDLATQSYVVNWRTAQFALDVTKLYRIRVLVAGTELGHADVLVAAKWTQLRDANTSEYVPVLIGTTLAIRFRIERGAIFVAGRSGSTVTALDGRVTLVIPSGALTSDVGITVGSTEAVPQSYRVAPGSAVELGPSGTVFAKPVQLTIKYDQATLPAGFRERALRLHTVVGTRWRPVLGGKLSLADRSVTGAIDHFSPYGAVSFAWDSISANGSDNPYSCGLSGGLAFCWGANGLGQLGIGQIGGDHPTPLAVSGGLTFQSVSAGDSGGTCGIASAGTAYCWGSNAEGQLGTGFAGDSPTPAAVSGGFTFVSLSTGFANSCGVATSYVAYCWGQGSGLSGPEGTPVVIPGGITWQLVSTGRFFGCGLNMTGIAYCWGINSNGQLGDGSSGDYQPAPTPVAVDSGFAFQAISAGGDHSCGISRGAAYCWGSNYSGQLGNGSNIGPETCYYQSCSTKPVAVTGGAFRSLSAGGSHSCALTETFWAYCWGANDSGQLGNGSLVASSTPYRVYAPGAETFKAMSAGVTHTCGITIGGDAYCWGSNQHGELGDGTTTSSTAPVAVVIP